MDMKLDYSDISFYFTGEITRKIPKIKIVRNIVDSRLHNAEKNDIMK